MTKRIRKAVSLLALVLSLGGQASAQEGLNYTQYMDNLTPLNQAYTLLESGASLNAMVRKQYVGLDGAPGAVYFNGSLPISSINGTAGLLLINDQFAIEQNLELSAFFAKGIQLTAENYLGVSLSAGIKKYTANYSSLDPTDPSFRDDIRDIQPTLGFGILYYSDRYFVGFSMPKLYIRGLGNASRQTVTELKNHYYFSGAYLLDLAEYMKLKPTGLAMYTQGQPLIADVSAILFIKNMLGVGAGFRTNKQVAGIISINTMTFRLGYSYQVSARNTNVIGFSNSSHEINIGFRFGRELKNKLL